MVLIEITKIATIPQQVSALTGGTFGFFAARWIGLFMLNTALWHFLLCRVLESRSGRNTETKWGSPWFPVDLGISLLNMWTGAFKPCDCKKCFFCLKGHTHGITHGPLKQTKVTVAYKCGTGVRMNECTNESVDLGKSSGTYFQMHYRKQITTEPTANKRKKTCRTSRLGCVICKEPVFTECWKEGYDKHA